VFQPVVSEGEVIGTLGITSSGKGLLAFNARTVVLATGGLGQLYRYSANPGTISGDGYALAYEAGATLANMEFIQFILGSVYPSIGFVLGGAIWDLCPSVRNANGDDLLKNLVSLSERSTLFSHEIDICSLLDSEPGRKARHGDP